MKTFRANETELDGCPGSEADLPVRTRVEMVIPGFSLDRSLAMGVAWGVVAWSAYAMVEHVLCSIVPLFSAERSVFTPLNWTLTAWLFNAYWMMGAIAGGICGAVVSRIPSGRASDDRPRLAGNISLYVAVLLAVLTVPKFQYGARTVIAIATALLLVTAWVLARPGSRLAPWVRIPPLLLVLLIQLPVWLGAEVLGMSGSLTRRSIMFLISAAILSGSYFLNRFRDWSPTRHLSANLAVLLVIVAGSAFISGRNRAIPLPPAALAMDPGTPPVVLISLDTTRADHLSLYGYSRKTTPHLEQLAQNATVYTNAVSAADWTLPSHASMFTGVYPSWHGARNYAVEPHVIEPLDGSFQTLASILGDRGVFTAGVAANKAFLSPEWGLGRGFQSFNVQSPVEVMSQMYTYNLRQGIRRLLSCFIDTGSFDTQYRSADDVNGDVFSTMEDRRVRDRSFFLFVNYMDAHAPFIASVPKGVSLPSGSGAPQLVEHMKFAKDMLDGVAPYPEPARRLSVERYDVGIAAEDEAVGDLVAWLKRRGLFDRALIIVTADHGEAFGEHHLANHGFGTYQDQVHVPLIIKYPGQAQPRTVTELVSHVDLLPTVLATLGISKPAHLQGMPLLNDSALSGRTVFAESFPNRPGTIPNPHFDRIERTVRAGNLKLIVSDKGKRELFDLSQDPLELHNLTARNLPEAQPLDNALRQWIGAIPARAKQAAPASQQQMDRLKGLGYVQ
jgi:arylsulfatase A-like enzyme